MQMIPLQQVQDYNLYTKLMLWADGIRQFRLYELFSSLFLHGSFMHLLLNMWGLFLFGSLVAPHLGGRKLIAIYLISGVLGNLLWLTFNWNAPYPLVGASGAVFGIMLAAAMLEPNQEFMMLLFPVPIKATTMVIVYGVIEIFSELSINDSIAHLAHLGGFVGAYFFLKFFYRGKLSWDPLKALGGARGVKVPRGWKVHDNSNSGSYSASGGAYDPNRPVSPREVDYVLDKISQSGINSLSEEERNLLKRAREQLRR